MALPSSRATPMDACPALRPRWCPAHSPLRAQDCGLPASGNRRLSSPYTPERYPAVHDSTHFGARSRGLHPRYTRLRTPPCGDARGFATDLLARLSSGGIGAVLARTHWVTTTNFMGFRPVPRFRAYLGATTAKFGGMWMKAPMRERRARSGSSDEQCGVLIPLACLACRLPGGVISYMYPGNSRQRKGLSAL
jgi:hypothetical protein